MKLFIYISIFWSFHIYSQQLPQYTQWSFNQFAGNAAHAGIKPCIDIHSLYRNQWFSFDGAPKSGFLTASFPLRTKGKYLFSARFGTGFKFETDRIGNFNTNRVNVAYAAHFNFDKTTRLSLGVFAGAVQMSYDASSSTTIDPDPAVLTQSNFLAPDASFGAWFNAENYYISASLKNLIPIKWKNIGDNSRHRFHSSLNAGYRFVAGERFTIIPAAIVRIPPKGPISADINLHSDYNNIIGFGVGYRNTDALLLFLNVRISGQFTIAYSFDYTLSSIQSVSKNTHEISLRFTSCKPDRRTTTGCPLFE